MEKKKSIGIWIRVSTEDQAKGESPEHHEQRARYYAEAKGWHIQTVYHLEALSGKSVIDYHETKRMLQDIKDGTITGLIFSKLARLARNTRELLDFADIFREYGADLISLQEAIDTSSPAGRLFYTMIAAMAQWEREEISERVSASVPIRAKLGKSTGGQPSFGYKWEDKAFTIDENEAPIRKLIYETFLKTKRKKTTANELNKMGYRTRNGSKFSDTTIERLIRDPNAKGERRANYTKSLGNKKNWVLKPETDWVITPCEAIVSVELWNECNRILDEQFQSRKPIGKKAAHLLSGFLWCDCGKKMYVFHEKSAKYCCKSCKIRITEEDIEHIYHEQLKSFLLTDKDIQEYTAKSNEALGEKESLLEILSVELKAILKKMDDMVEMRLNNEMEKEAFSRHYKPLEVRTHQIQEQLPILQAEIDFLKIQVLSSDVVIREAKNLYERWPVLPFEEKRSIVEAITKKITVGKEDIAISLSYLPSTNSGNGQRVHKDS